VSPWSLSMGWHTFLYRRLRELNHVQIHWCIRQPSRQFYRSLPNKIANAMLTLYTHAHAPSQIQLCPSPFATQASPPLHLIIYSNPNPFKLKKRRTPTSTPSGLGFSAQTSASNPNVSHR
jgi:hypothetical protein